ncbi:MAG: hypothetical protein JSR21_21445 [Proteobacteria bacterium]|nr:hypothetical protein [Pseudomonadota bacterium]
MIIPNVGHQYQYQHVVSAGAGSTSGVSGDFDDSAAAAAGASSSSAPSSASAAPGSANAFGELSSLMQQFLLQIQGGPEGTATGTATGTASGTASGTTSGGTGSTGVDGPTEGGQRAAALQAYVANQGGFAANADRTLGGLYGPARNYAANHDLDIASRFPGAVSAASANAQTLSGVTLGEAARALGAGG